MRNIVIVLIGLFVVGCGPEHKPPISVDTVEKDVVKLKYSTGGTSTIYMIDINYRGHKYILLSRNGQGGLVHDPDCPCGVKNVKIQ